MFTFYQFNLSIGLATVCLFSASAAHADYQRPTTMRALVSAESTEAMIAKTGAFKVPLGNANSLIFQRQPDGSYSITARLPRYLLFSGCAVVTYTKAGEEQGFAVCDIENWHAPEGFEHQIVAGYDFKKFTQLLEETNAPLPAIGGTFEDGDLPNTVIAITYNGSPEINAELWNVAAEVMLTCREPEGRSTAGFSSPELDIDTSRSDCREDKSALSDQMLAAAQDQLEIAQTESNLAAKQLAAAEAQARSSAEERAAAEARAKFLAEVVQALSQ